MPKPNKSSAEYAEQPENRAEPPHEPGAPVDTWLDDRVRALYQSVLEEPLPDDMLSRLLRKQTH